MKKIAVIGKFHTAQGIADGQAVKTNILTEELEQAFGRENILRINTYGWKKHPVGLFASCAAAVRKCTDVIFMTDAGGIKVFPWLLRMANIGGTCRLHYVVIGGWLCGYLAKQKLLAKLLMKFEGIYVETRTMQRAMEALGFSNIVVMPNCKRLSMLGEDELVYDTNEPHRLCIFSRIMREKGVPEAVEAVRTINERSGRQVYTLELYGQVDPDQQDWFERLQAEFPPYIRYGGTIDYHRSVEVLKDYFALLFPTKFYTEGIPGTIIDAYAAGIPVISSRWESFGDILDDETCLSYAFDDENGLLHALEAAAEDPDLLLGKKAACLARAKEYTTEHVMEILISRLRQER